MKLRIARKMGQRFRCRDKRPWWSIYTDEQYQRAEVRLRRSWSRACPALANGLRSVSPDFFAANRAESRRTRQRALRRHGAGES